MQSVPLLALLAGLVTTMAVGNANAQVPTPTMTVNAGLGTKQFASAFNMTMTGVGSGTNGPQTAQYGMSVGATKSNWVNTTVAGRVASVNVNLNQGGPSSDGRGLVINEENTGLGFSNGAEMVASNLNPANYALLPLFVDVQLANASSGGNIGAVFTPVNGTGTAGILVNTVGAASWSNILQAAKNGRVYFTVSGSGSIVTSGKVTVAGLVSTGPVQATSNPITEISDSHVLQRRNCGTTIRNVNPTALTFVVPAGLPIGCHVQIIQAGSGKITFESRELTEEHFGTSEGTPVRTTGLDAQAELLIDSTHTMLVGGEVEDAPLDAFLDVSFTHVEDDHDTVRRVLR